MLYKGNITGQPLATNRIINCYSNIKKNFYKKKTTNRIMAKRVSFTNSTHAVMEIKT